VVIHIVHGNAGNGRVIDVVHHFLLCGIGGQGRGGKKQGGEHGGEGAFHD
jgi:hypothetical protein